ncbi:hypothetical protein JIN85_20675, partial [Luteolibacter pohnpeiensis]
AMGGTNKDIVLTARRPGSVGNDITFAIHEDTFDDLSVDRVGNAIMVYRKTGGNTAAEIVDAINSTPPKPAFFRNGDDGVLHAINPGADGDGIEVRFRNEATQAVGKVVTVKPGTGAEVAALLAAEPSTARLVRADDTGLFKLDREHTLGGHNSGAAGIVYADLAPGNDGSGKMLPLVATNLTGGNDGPTVAPGRRARVVISGPELDTFLPPDKSEFIRVRTEELYGMQVHLDFNARVQQFATAAAQLREWPNTYGGATYAAGKTPTTRSKGTSQVSGFLNYLRTPDFADWMYDLEPSFGPVIRAGTYWYREEAQGVQDLSEIGKTLYDNA